MSITIGLDIGGTSVKALALDEQFASFSVADAVPAQSADVAVLPTWLGDGVPGLLARGHVLILDYEQRCFLRHGIEVEVGVLPHEGGELHDETVGFVGDGVHDELRLL